LRCCPPQASAWRGARRREGADAALIAALAKKAILRGRGRGRGIGGLAHALAAFRAELAKLTAGEERDSR